MSKPAQTAEKGETVIYQCPCGKTHQLADVEHYDRLLLKCGNKVWAIRPLRNGPLKLNPWPGPNLTAAELRERQAEEWKNLRKNFA